MRQRDALRKHSKSALLAATGALYRERRLRLEVERRRWYPRLAVAAAGGAALGALVARLLP